MNGIVNAELELTIDTYIRGPKGEAPITAIIDTGYNGYLSLPFHPLSTCSHCQDCLQRGHAPVTAVIEMFTYYELEIEWNGHFKNIQALVACQAILSLARPYSRASN